MQTSKSYVFFTGVNTFDFTVITIHTKPGLNPKHEINQLDNILTTYTNEPHCYSGNAIIMGDFNQGTNFVGSRFHSFLDQKQQYRQLMYNGGSTLATKPPQTHDRYSSMSASVMSRQCSITS